MEEVRKIETHQVDKRCPVCQNGWMRSTGIVLTSEPPQYPHRCTNCGYEETYSVNYPYIVGR